MAAGSGLAAGPADVPVPQDTCEKEYRAALREQTRCHAMSMDGELTKEKIFRHYRDALTEREKESDFQPFNCIQDMLDKQEPVTVAELARKTGLSREFFYKNEELRKVLTQARKQQGHIVFQRPQMAAIDKAMEMHLKELQKELVKVREENKTLKAENEKLKSALKKRDLKILRGL